MLDKISSWLVDKLLYKQEMDNADKEICIYSVQTLIYTIVSTVLLICLGFLFHEPVCACIIIGVFYISQTVGGGKHAKKRIACISIMIVFMCIGLIICRYSIPPIICILSSSASIIYLLYKPLVLHPNKEFLYEQKEKLIRKSRRITSILCIILISILCFLPQHLPAYSIGLAFSALSRLFAVAEQNKQRY